MGTKEGAKKARAKILERYGEDFFKSIGGKGGKACVSKGFALDLNRAREAGRIGGKKSKRGPAKKVDNE